jgi:UbiD family decarboxylase
MTTPAPSIVRPALIGPFLSFRDYATALEHHGRLLRIGEMDQDRFEATGFAYRMIEEMGYQVAPAFLIERIRTGGKWLEGPVLGNVFPGWTSEALAYGVSSITTDGRAMYRATRDHLSAKLSADGRWPRIAPAIVSRSDAPVKEVVLKGDAANLHDFPWIQTNPGDAGP